MTSTQDSKQNPNDAFWLVRYAYTQTAPLFDQVKAIEPSLHTAFTVAFSDLDSKYFDANAVEVSAYWSRDGMFQMSPRLYKKADVDRFVAKLAADVTALSPMVSA